MSNSHDFDPLRHLQQVHPQTLSSMKSEAISYYSGMCTQSITSNISGFQSIGSNDGSIGRTNFMLDSQNQPTETNASIQTLEMPSITPAGDEPTQFTHNGEVMDHYYPFPDYARHSPALSGLQRHKKSPKKSHKKSYKKSYKCSNCGKLYKQFKGKQKHEQGCGKHHATAVFSEQEIDR